MYVRVCVRVRVCVCVCVCRLTPPIVGPTDIENLISVYPLEWEYFTSRMKSKGYIAYNWTPQHLFEEFVKRRLVPDSILVDKIRLWCSYRCVCLSMRVCCCVCAMLIRRRAQTVARTIRGITYYEKVLTELGCDHKNRKRKFQVHTQPPLKFPPTRNLSMIRYPTAFITLTPNRVNQPHPIPAFITLTPPTANCIDCLNSPYLNCVNGALNPLTHATTSPLLHHAHASHTHPPPRCSCRCRLTPRSTPSS